MKAIAKYEHLIIKMTAKIIYQEQREAKHLFVTLPLGLVII